MEERNTVKLKKEELSIKEHIQNYLGKGKISKIRIEYTPVGERIHLTTHKPGLIIGRKGERIQELTAELKRNFKLTNPKVEIDEVTEPELDAKIMADEIALGLERFGPVKFKVIAYRTLQKIMKAGALGVEIKLNGKLPSSRAKNWRFAQGYLKKTGEPSKLVDRAQSRAQTKPGTVGVNVSILTPYVKMIDKIDIDEKLLAKLKENSESEVEEAPKKKIKKKTRKK